MNNNIRTYSTDDKLISERRRKIAVAAVRLMAKKAYSRLPVREIAKECGIAPGTIYHYIGSKDDVINLVAHLDRAYFVKFIEDAKFCSETMDPVNALRHSIDMYYKRIDKGQDLILFFYQEAKSLSPALVKEVFEWEFSSISAFEQLLVKGCESGDFEIEDTTLVANQIVTEGEMWATRRWLIHKHWTLDEYIAKCTNFFLRAIKVKACME
jgi:AcrR family transcriptional regulator